MKLTERELPKKCCLLEELEEGTYFIPASVEVDQTVYVVSDRECDGVWVYHIGNHRMDCDKKNGEWRVYPVNIDEIIYYRKEF